MKKITNENFGDIYIGSLKENKNIKGITLVALVITIIILLILAGISISVLTQTGLFGKAKQAEQKSKDAQELENSTLGSYENSINEIISTGSREENSNNNQYSLEEKAIGTWIDGKTIYSKMIDMGTNFSIDEKNVDIEKIIQNIDFPVKATIYMIDTKNNIKTYTPCQLWLYSGSWGIAPIDNWNAGLTRHVYFYVEYTKN